MAKHNDRSPGQRIRLSQTARDILAVALCLGLACLAAEAFYALGLGPQNAIIVFTLSILIVSVRTRSNRYSLAAAVAGVFLFDFLVTPPRLGFSFTRGFPVTLLIMLMVALVMNKIAAKIKMQARRAEEKERRAEQLYRLNDRLLSARDLHSIAAETAASIAERLGWPSCVYPARLRLADGSLPPEAAFCGPGALDERLCSPRVLAEAAALLAGSGGEERPPRAPGLPPIRLYPLTLQAQTIGVLAVCADLSAPQREDEQFLALLAGQAAQALHLEDLAFRQQQAAIAAEAEKARNSFLRAISHDLRTPLTSIIGASSLLAEGGAGLSEQTRRLLSRDIHNDATRLLSMVQNTLSATRMQHGAAVVKKAPEAAEEVVAEAVSSVRKRFPGCHIEVRAPKALLWVPMDAMLISQVLTNLLENALRHAGRPDPTVWVSLEQAEEEALITVEDNGQGIPPEIMPSLFDLANEPGGHSEDVSSGFGMGLSICRTIISAHGGHIKAQNRKGGGAAFQFTLPLEENK